MYRKTLSLGLAVVFACLALAGCGKKDDQINGFITELDKFTAELVSKVESGGDPDAGADAGQKYLDENKASMRSKFDDVKNIGENQVTPETKEKLKQSFYNNGVKLGQLQAKYGSDPEVRAKLQKMTNEYLEMFKM